MRSLRTVAALNNQISEPDQVNISLFKISYKTVYVNIMSEETQIANGEHRSLMNYLRQFSDRRDAHLVKSH